MTPAATRLGVSLTAVQLSGVDLARAPMLNDAERDRANAFRFPAQRNRFIAGRIAMRLHISALTGDDPRDIKASYVCPSCPNQSSKGHGSPRYHVPSRTGPVRASLSRSGDWCLLAATLNDKITIGVDLEKRDSADFDGFPEVAMTARERSRLRDVPPASRSEFMTRIWVRKEASLKALGTGLAMAPSRVDVSDAIPKVVGGPTTPGHWQLEDTNPTSVGLPNDFFAAFSVRR